MPKFRIVSDLHLEFYKFRGDIYNLLKNRSKVDYLILAGDIVTLETKDSLKQLVNYVHHDYKNIFYVLGNHEFYKTKAYNRGLQDVRSSLDDVYRLYKDFSRDINAELGYESLIMLENETYTTSENIKIFGATLWTNMTEDVYYAMNDHLFLGYYDIIGRHAETVGNIEKNRSDIIITHHIPSFKCIHERYQGSSINSGFASNCDHLIKDIKYWVYGHTHIPKHDVINGIDVLCNPYGYEKEREGGEYPDKIIEIL